MDPKERWTELSLIEHFGEGPSPELADAIIAAHKRGQKRELPESLGIARHGWRVMAVAALTSAAAALVLALLLIPRPVSETNTHESVQGNSAAEGDWNELVTVVQDSDTLADVGPDLTVLTRGSVLVELEDGQTYAIKLADRTLKLTGPAEARASLTPLRQVGPPVLVAEDQGTNWKVARLTDVPLVMAIVQLISGMGILEHRGFETILEAPEEKREVLRDTGGGAAWFQPLTMAEVFADLDESGDKALIDGEVTTELIRVLDSNGDDKLTFHEFEAVTDLSYDATPRIIPFSRVFRESDHNGDGKLDADELNPGLLSLGDRDGNASLDLAEAESLFDLVESAPEPQKGGEGSRSGMTIKDLFAFLDADGDGSIGDGEIRDEILSELDADDSGDLDRDEFSKLDFRSGLRLMTPEQEFNRADKNGDGVITEGEAPDGLLRFMDTNGDGEVSFEEFLAVEKGPTPD